MEDKTVGLIRYIKHHVGDYKTLRESAIAYMSEYSGCKILEWYEHGEIERIVFDMFLDFIDSVDKPSMVLRQIEDSKKMHREYLNEEFPDIEAILISMMMVQVRDGNRYVNGFKAEDFES